MAEAGAIAQGKALLNEAKESLDQAITMFHRGGVENIELKAILHDLEDEIKYMEDIVDG